MSKFTAELCSCDCGTRLSLAGVLDDDNELFGLEDRIQGDRIIIDLAGIHQVNSAGEQDWVNWLSLVEKSGKQLVFANCSPAIVSRLNRIENFTANGIVESFLAPYYCPSCHDEKLLQLDTRPLIETVDWGTVPVKYCDECGAVLAFNEVGQSYFAFLSAPRRLHIGPRPR